MQKDDVYGFRMTGSNADSDARLLGTLTLGVTAVTLGSGGGLGGSGGGAGMGGAIFGHG